MTIPRFVPACLLASILAASASAQVLVHQWRFGENDPGATNGGTVTTTQDNVGTLDLTVSGTVTYTNVTAGASSTLAQSFGTAASFSAAADTSLSRTSRFVIEGWFYLNGTQANTTNILFYNGNASSSGAGLYVRGTTLRYLQGGSADVVAGTLTANQWNYVALAYEAGSLKVFVNGETTPSYAGAHTFNAFNGNTETFSIGSGLDVSVDELNVWTFSGSFNSAMLSYDTVSAVPEPSTYAALAGAAALGFVAWRRRRAAPQA